MVMKKENERGITLIALVITIIVLIILASVGIAMLTGENGILKKASTAKERTLEAEYEEKIKLAILGARDNNGNFSKELLNDELKKYGLSGKTDENGTTTVEANGKTYTIDNKGTLTSKDSTGNDDNKGIKDITAQMVAEHPETYYGLKVTNYTSTNGQDDWRIFYSDGTHIFLITGDYVDLSVANRLDSNTGMTKIGNKYRVKWDSAPSSLQTNKDKDGNDIDSIVKTRFMTTGYTLNSSNENSRCVSTLLNTSNWESYKDNGNMAEYAIGGSTIEMWMASWNELCDKKYNKPSDKLYCNKTNSTGYYLGTRSNPTSTSIDSSEMRLKDGYNKSSLYYPRHGNVSDGYASCDDYWLASPSAYGNGNVLYVNFYGNVECDGYYLAIVGLRPVVSLNSGIKVNAIEAE